MSVVLDYRVVICCITCQISLIQMSGFLQSFKGIWLKLPIKNSNLLHPAVEVKQFFKFRTSFVDFSNICELLDEKQLEIS